MQESVEHCGTEGSRMSIGKEGKAMQRDFRRRDPRLILPFALSLDSGCEAYVIREGWEGLVRGNDEDAVAKATEPHSGAPLTTENPLPDRRQGGFVATYGEGELLKEGEGEQTLKGRYIIRVSLPRPLHPPDFGSDALISLSSVSRSAGTTFEDTRASVEP